MAIINGVIETDFPGIAFTQILEVGARIKAECAIRINRHRTLGRLFSRVGQCVAISIGTLERESLGQAIFICATDHVGSRRVEVDIRNRDRRSRGLSRR